MSHRVDVDGGQIVYKWLLCCTVLSIIEKKQRLVEMFSWLREKSTTSYNSVPDDQSSIMSNSRPQTTSSTSHQTRYSNGRQIFDDLDRNIC